MEIIHLAVQGLKNKEIAEEQKVAEITIKKAMSTIYRKLNISGRPELLTIFGEEKHEEE
jgi:LuxR family maltose regulon positive regulatory protein